MAGARKVEHFADESLIDFDEEEEERKREAIKKEIAQKKKKLVTEHLDHSLYPDAGNDVLEGLDSYIKWHKEHPNCCTPRPMK
jgi:hypothetical protein